MKHEDNTFQTFVQFLQIIGSQVIFVYPELFILKYPIILCFVLEPHFRICICN